MDTIVNDMITLENGHVYCVFKMLQNQDDEFYLLLNRVVSDKLTDKFRIVRYVKEGDDGFVEEITDDELFMELKEQFEQIIEHEIRYE